MHVEVPEFKRCCCCIPLRRGLIGYSYLRLGLGLINAGYAIWISVMLYYFLGGLQAIWGLLLIISVVLLDCSFSVLLIVAGHKKSPKLMRASYICGIVWLCIELIFTAFVIFGSITRLIRFWYYSNFIPRKQLIMDVGIGFTLALITIFMQGYVILLIRSEMTKLQNQSLEMQFTNHAADGEARCVRADRQDVENVTIIKA